MAENDDLDRVWTVIERVGVCMLTIRAARGLRARPLEARLDRSSKLIWFVTDFRSTKDHEIGADHEIGLVFVDKAENVYLSSPLPRRRCAIVRSLLRSGGPPTICGGTDLMTRMPDSCGSLRGRRSYGTGRRARRWRCSSFSNRRLLARSLISARIAKRRWTCDERGRRSGFLDEPTHHASIPKSSLERASNGRF